MSSLICEVLDVFQVFKPDKMNGYDVQTEADAMMERQRRDILPTLHPQTPKVTRENRYATFHLCIIICILYSFYYFLLYVVIIVTIHFSYKIKRSEHCFDVVIMV